MTTRCTQLLPTAWQWKGCLTSRLVDHIKNKLLRFILHLQRRQLKLLQVWICTRTRHFFKLMHTSVYPKLVQQQVEDLSGGHRAVDSYVSDRAVRWSEHRRLGNKKETSTHLQQRGQKVLERFHFSGSWNTLNVLKRKERRNPSSWNLLKANTHTAEADE